MRYFIDFDKTVNQFVPHYLGGRRLVLFLQSLLVPLQQINNTFAAWAKETRIEASMTSQVFKLEWFLNRRFRKYFVNPEENIRIANSTVGQGLALYYEGAVPDEQNPALSLQKNHTPSDPVLNHIGGVTAAHHYSFMVSSPAINTEKITESNYISQLQYWLDRYRLAGKTYIITINQ